MIKGAQATTAIEGNTLTVEEIEEIQKGRKLPKSREYLQVEVENIIHALNEIVRDLAIDSKIELINPKIIKKFHKMVGKNLGDHFQAVHGKYRNNKVVMGTYRASEFKEVPELTDDFRDWLRKEFHYEKKQSFIEAIIESIVTHIYIVWIHPFSDGNGRTARLLEYYLLIRSGVPDIASHVLSNFYNLTRNEYYRQIKKATKSRDLTEFIQYAVSGFCDGLFEILGIIQDNQLEITWRNYVYNIFEQQTGSGRTAEANKRRRNLLLQLPFDRSLSADEILNLNISIVKHYAKLSEKTFTRDLEELVNLDLVEEAKDGYRARVELLVEYMPVQVEV